MQRSADEVSLEEPPKTRKRVDQVGVLAGRRSRPSSNDSVSSGKKQSKLAFKPEPLKETMEIDLTEEEEQRPKPITLGFVTSEETAKQDEL